MPPTAPNQAKGIGHGAWGIEQRSFAQKRIQFFTPYALYPLRFFKRHAPCAMPYAFKHASLRQVEQVAD
jgi:hypothetical protein